METPRFASLYRWVLHCLQLCWDRVDVCICNPGVLVMWPIITVEQPFYLSRSYGISFVDYVLIPRSASPYSTQMLSRGKLSNSPES